MTHSIKFSDITISPDRQRQDFEPEAVMDLANSISAHGLMHPPVVRDTPTGWILVAGERRLRAMETIWIMGRGIRHNGIEYPPEIVPAASLGELSEIEAEEAELDENLKRKDLTWQEQAAAIARLHALRTKQAEALGQVQSLGKTFEELPAAMAKGFAREDMSKGIIIAEHLNNPEVAKQKSAKEAFKVLKKQEAQKKNLELSERVGRTFNSSVHQLYHSECLEWMKTCPDNSFDVILTDPPYGMSAEKFGDGAGRLVNSEHHYDDSLKSWANLINDLAPELFRVAKPQAHAYIFCDFDNFHRLKLYMLEAGWYVFRTPIINYKPRSGRVPLPEHGPRRQYEILLYAIKGHKSVNAIYSDVITTTLEENLTHGAQKPVELYLDLLRRSVKPGDSVFDPFAGTGTIFPAAHAVKCRATGIEMSAEYYGIAVKRLNDLDSEPNLI